MREKDRGGGRGDDEEGFPLGEVGEGGASEAKGSTVVGVCGGEVVAGKDGVLHEAAALLAAPHTVLVLYLGYCAPHRIQTNLQKVREEGRWSRDRK